MRNRPVTHCLRPVLIALLIITSLLSVVSFVGQARSQASVTSFSTTSESSTLTIGTITEITTSSYGPATGFIPGVFSAYEGPTVCFYVPYAFHIDASAQRIQGVISGSSPFNFYIMSKPQYNYFALLQPPCGSSYIALKLEYSIRNFIVNWTAPNPGDYYILLENTSAYEIAYNIQLTVVQPASILSYSTTTAIQTLTFIQQQAINSTTTQSESAPPSAPNLTPPIAIGLVAAAIIILILAKRPKRIR